MNKFKGENMRKIFIYGVIFLSLFILAGCTDETKTPIVDATPTPTLEPTLTPTEETPTPTIVNTYDITFENNG